jgi:hypothetical protein
MSAKDEPLNRTGMTTAQRDEWNRRPTTTKTLEHCNECSTLKEDVTDNHSAYPKMDSRCCSACWTKMLRDAQTGIDYYTDFMC